MNIDRINMIYRINHDINNLIIPVNPVKNKGDFNVG